MAEKKLTEEHLALLAEAEELGVNTMGMNLPNSRLDTLRDAIARRTAALATEAAAKERLEQAAAQEEEAAQEERDAIRTAFDETMADTRGVLVRVVEWTEWLPIASDENEPRLTVANGVTGFEAGKHEKVLTVEGIGTQRVKNVEDEGLTRRFMLYAFKATLAQNVHTSLIPTLVDAQGSHEEGEVAKPSRIITPDDGQPPGGPNRAARRHPR
jgi:hypothetical protein